MDEDKNNLSDKRTEKFKKKKKICKKGISDNGKLFMTSIRKKKRRSRDADV